MTIELVDGKAGTAHISSEDKAIIHQAKFGAGDMVFEWGDAMSCTMQSANKAVIGTGCASIQGLDWHITNPETVTIQSGSSGKNRNDIICAHYHRETSTGVEKVELVAFKGVPSDGAAVDPTIPSAKILNGAADAYMPLWRIPLTGITAGTPVRLFNKRYALWDSVTLERQIWHGPYGMTVHLAKVGMMAFAFGNTSFTYDINSNGQTVNETMDAGFLPEGEGTILLEGVNEQHGALSFDSDGKVTISGRMNSGYYFRVCGCWPVK
uniref:hypothetical protein n=1 Tax=Bifidobacterium adolescentis TaxID=1680 RepID=UPI00359C4610